MLECTHIPRRPCLISSHVHFVASRQGPLGVDRAFWTYIDSTFFMHPGAKSCWGEAKLTTCWLLYKGRPCSLSPCWAFIFKQTRVCFQSNFRPPVGLQHRPQKQSNWWQEDFITYPNSCYCWFLKKGGYFHGRNSKDDLRPRFGWALPAPSELYSGFPEIERICCHIWFSRTGQQGAAH